MAIKDQCNNCKSRDYCELEKVFDNTSCDWYHKAIDIEKHSSSSSIEESPTPSNYNTPTTDEYVITSESLKETTTIGGWLAFFLFAIIIGGLISAIYPIVTYNIDEYDGCVILALSDIVFGIMLCALSIYTVYSFRQRKSNAVFLAKTYVIVVFVSNLLALFSDEFEPTGLGSLQQVIRGLVWAIIWYTYLCVSKQIREIIPKEYRKLRNSDYGILVTFIILPLLILSIAIGSIQNSRQDEALNFIEKVELKDGEYTDGRIVFKLPAGFSCKKEETDGFVFYSVENEEVGTATICSDYDNDKSVKNIQSYWANWEDEDAKPYESSIINNEKEERNGHSIFKIVKKYNIDGTFVFWRFLMLFDDASSKVCVISCYDNGVDYYVDELSNSIRFN